MIAETVLLFLAFITLSISSGFITNSSIRITGINEYDTNTDLQTAHTNSVRAAVIGWISVALILGLTIGYIVYTQKKSKSVNKTIFIVLFILTMISVITVGIFSALTAYYINSSKVTDNNLSYQQAIIATVTSIVVFVLLLVSLFILLFSGGKGKDKKDEIPLKREVEKREMEIKEMEIPLKREMEIKEPSYPAPIHDSSTPTPAKLAFLKREAPKPPKSRNLEENLETYRENLEPNRNENLNTYRNENLNTDRNENLNTYRNENLEPNLNPYTNPYRKKYINEYRNEGDYLNIDDDPEVIQDYIKRHFGVRLPNWVIKHGRNFVESYMKRNYPEVPLRYKGQNI